MQMGSALYIGYYYFAPATPLWDGIATTTLMFLANAWTISRILSDRRVSHFYEDDLVIFSAIPNIAPGDYRRLMSMGQKGVATVDMDLTYEGMSPHHLWFLISGSATMEKLGESRKIVAPPSFVGEVSYLLERSASATVTLAAGGRYVCWPIEELRAYVEGHESLKVSLEAAFNRDLAIKLAAS